MRNESNEHVTTAESGESVILTTCESTTLPATREEALALGKTKYFSGKPCRNGHVSFRWTNSWGCAECCKTARVKNRRAEKAKRLKLFHAAKHRCKSTGVDFTISIDDVVIPTTCPVLGIALESGGGGFSNNSPSIDRVSPDKGYTPENIRVISWRANKLKSDATLDEMVAVLNYMLSCRGSADTLRYDHNTGRLRLHTIEEFD